LQLFEGASIVAFATITNATERKDSHVMTATSSALPVGAQSAELGVFILRIALGVMFIAHALLKLLVFSLPGTAQFFQSVGLPGALAYVVFAAELVGGIALVLGIYSRQVALLLVPVLLGAAWVHWPNGWLFTNKNGGWEYPVFLAATALAHWLAGDGAYALKRGGFLVPNK
jgi:putative oxidoreductase